MGMAGPLLSALPLWCLVMRGGAWLPVRAVAKKFYSGSRVLTRLVAGPLLPGCARVGGRVPGSDLGGG
ncbi:hypothetical protein GCM10010233_52140 [Streptomyces pseudogriseolus]|nr:hypothetical protein GCM10010233_52140 [Streptomyces gancidicus]